MESTGKNWIPIFNRLESDIHVCLTHPKYVKAIKGKKTDKKDSKWIADQFDLVRNSFIPPEDIRALREIARYRFKLVCIKASEKNRIQNCMTISNIGIASIFSDPFGVTATQIIDYLLTSDTFDEKECRKLIKGQAKKKSDAIISSIQGFELHSDQALKMSLAKNHLDYLQHLFLLKSVRISKAGQYLKPLLVQCALAAIKRKKTLFFI